MVGKSSLQEIATLAIIREISYSNLETGKSPGLSERVDSTALHDLVRTTQINLMALICN